MRLVSSILMSSRRLTALVIPVERLYGTTSSYQRSLSIPRATSQRMIKDEEYGIMGLPKRVIRSQQYFRCPN